MNTTRNLAKVFAMALRAAVNDLIAISIVHEGDEAVRANACGSIEAIAEELEKYSAAAAGIDYEASYTTLRDAIDEQLGDYIHEDDVAEEAIYVDAIVGAGVRLLELEQQLAAETQPARAAESAGSPPVARKGAAAPHSASVPVEVPAPDPAGGS